jgi:hypothetical protein
MISERVDSLKTLEAVGNNFYVAPVQKKLACRGSSNSETVCFKLNRYAGKTDLSECHCTIKTKNSEGKSDVAIPEVTADDKKLIINWVPSSGATVAAGPLQVQVQLEKIFDDKNKNINWQSNIMDFKITDSLDATDEIEDQDPTIFQQWEEKVNTLYSDAAKDVQSMQTLRTEVQADVDTVAQQEQSVEQAAAQVTQDAQDAAGSAQNAAVSATDVQASATRAQTSASDAQTAQGLAQKYSEAAKTYSDSATDSAQSAQASAQSAQQQAETAQEAALQAQQKVDDFSGYTKEEIDNGFANVLIGKASGQTVTLNDVQPNTSFRSLLITGQTMQDGSGTSSPDNVRTIHGTTSLTISDGGSQSKVINLPKELYSLPDGTADSYDAVSGQWTQKIGIALFADNGYWTVGKLESKKGWPVFSIQLADFIGVGSSIITEDKGYVVSDKFKNGTVWQTETIRAVYSKYIYICIDAQRLSGWSEDWTDDQKIAAFKTWLKANPVTVIYKLANPVDKINSLGTDLPKYFPNAALSVNLGNLEVQYGRNLSAAIAKIENTMKQLPSS